MITRVAIIITKILIGAIVGSAVTYLYNQRHMQLLQDEVMDLKQKERSSRISIKEVSRHEAIQRTDKIKELSIEAKNYLEGYCSCVNCNDQKFGFIPIISKCQLAELEVYEKRTSTAYETGDTIVIGSMRGTLMINPFVNLVSKSLYDEYERYIVEAVRYSR